MREVREMREGNGRCSQLSVVLQKEEQELRA